MRRPSISFFAGMTIGATLRRSIIQEASRLPGPARGSNLRKASASLWRMRSRVTAARPRFAEFRLNRRVDLQDRVLVLDEIAEVAVFLVADWGLDADRFLGDLSASCAFSSGMANFSTSSSAVGSRSYSCRILCVLIRVFTACQRRPPPRFAIMATSGAELIVELRPGNWN